MVKIVLLIVLATIVCAYAYPTSENENAEDLTQPEITRVERAASPVASADPGPYRGGGGGYGWKHQGHHYPPQHHHYPKHGCHRCGHRG